MTEGRRRRLVLRAGTLLLLAGITWADYVTGYELGLFVLYFAPIALAAWEGGRAPGVAYALLAGACWYGSNRLSAPIGARPLLLYWEAFMRLVSFLVTALALARIRDDLRRREELLDVISHDLRGPLGALAGHAQLLRKRGGDAFVAGRVDAILRCASRMEAMIEDLLDSARSRSQQLQPRVEPVEVRRHLSELLDRYASVLDAGRVRLAVEGHVPLTVHADPGHLDRIVLNLLQNALKYSPPESPVELGAAAEGGRVVIRVADRGPGISPSHLPHVFDRFYRGDRASSRAGLGLGLYSVRLLVEAHRGAVWAEPGPEGGTVFRVALPAAAAAGAQGSPARAAGARS